MSHPFKDYEIEVLASLLSTHFTRQELLDLLDRAEPTEAEYDGYGFFVTAAHPAFGRGRRVCSDPLMLGDTGDKTASFVAFLEDSELTLETFPPDGESLPADFRNRDVKITFQHNANA